MCRFGGGNSYPLVIGTMNDNFLAYGTLVGFAIIVPAILFTYLLGANLTILARNLLNVVPMNGIRPRIQQVLRQSYRC